MSDKVEIKVLENGPLLISGTATVTDAEGVCRQRFSDTRG